MTTFPQAQIPVFSGYPDTGDFDGWVENTFGFLTSGAVFRAQQQASGGQALAGSGAFVPLSWDTIQEDPYGGFSSAGTSGQLANSWLAPYTGLYEITVRASVTAGTTFLTAAINITGSAVSLWGDSAKTPSGTPGAVCGSWIVPLAGGFDYVRAGAVLSAAATTSTASTQYPSFEIAYLSAG